ncbi:response regulator transcription factor [Streptomyces shenzhenensis]|uniref:helix-turn-helix transcriptional regulator n=1 Tax=Streptomyces shenzhenensis TaxID=943815 RepID=UPI00381CEBA8
MLAHAERITVALQAQDPVSQAGISSHLRPRPEVTIVEWDPDAEEQPQVIVVILDVVDDTTLRLLRRIQRTSTARGVLVTTRIDEHQVVHAAECGFLGVVRRSEATPDRLIRVICSVAKGEGRVPPDVLGSLLEQVGHFQGQKLTPKGLSFGGLSAREIEVLRLIAEGYNTAGIAEKLSYSERTVKNILHAVVNRLNLRNRTHAVVYAMRHGLI